MLLRLRLGHFDTLSERRWTFRAFMLTFRDCAACCAKHTLCESTAT